MQMRIAIAVLFLAGATQAQAARPLTEMLAQVPPPPASAQAAAAWLDGDREISDGRWLAAAAAIKAESDAGTQSATQTAQTQAGNAGLAIDHSRLQDPAYQAELQRRYSTMTPAEMTALAGQAQAGAAQDAMRMAQEPPEVMAAYQAWQQLNVAMAGAGANHYTVVEAREMSAIAARFDPQQAALSQQLQDCNECTEGGVAAAAASNRAVWKQKLALADQELREWQAYFVKAKAARAGVIAQGHADLAATGYGAKARSLSMKQGLASYQLMLLGRIDELMKVPEEAARRAGAVALEARVAAGS